MVICFCFQSKPTVAAFIEIPLFFSIDKASVMAEPLSTLPLVVVTPDLCKKHSVRDVLPASTWARIPMVKLSL